MRHGWLAVGFYLLGAATAVAQTDAEPDAAAPSPESTLEEIVVRGRSDSAVGIADSASQGTIGAEQIAERPLSRPGEVLETVPGVILTQHSGAGKANQFFLRGATRPTSGSARRAARSSARGRTPSSISAAASAITATTRAV